MPQPVRHEGRSADRGQDDDGDHSDDDRAGQLGDGREDGPSDRDGENHGADSERSRPGAAPPGPS